jgi:hypothetical protein
MRHVRLSLGLLAATLALAITAAPALAHEFTGSVGKKSKGAGAGEQEFRFGVFKILCEGAKAKGTGLTTSPQKTFFTEVKYSHCSTEAHIGGEPFFLKTRFKTPVDYEYHANGFVETGAEAEEGSVAVSGGAVEMKVAGLKCIIDWPAQTVPVKAEAKPEGEFSAATFTNVAEPTTSKKFTDGFKHKVSISNSFKGMEYEYEEGACEEFEKTEGKNGAYKGTMLQEINGGNLEFQ